MPPAITGNFANLIAPGLKKVWFKTLEGAKKERDVLLNVVPTSRKYEENVKVGELGSAVQKDEDVAINYVNTTISDLKRFTQVAYGLGFRVSREMYDFDLYGPMRKMSSMLAESIEDRFEIVGASVWNNAFDVAYGGFVSSESLCSTSHALQGGGTASNRPSTDVDFSLSALQAACDSLEGILNEVSMPRPIKPRLVFGHYGYKWAFREVLGSPYKPYTAQNEINPIQDEDIQWLLSHRMLDTDQWFLQGPKDKLGVWFFVSKKPVFDNADDFDTKGAKFSTYGRCVAGYDEWRGIYGSSGG